MLHLDLDVIAQDDFAATNLPDSDGLSLAEVRSSLVEFVKQKNLLGLDVAQYNPDKDPDGSAAKKVVDLLADALAARLESLAAPTPPAATPPTEDTPSATA
jgi:arginase family enzyme